MTALLAATLAGGGFPEGLSATLPLWDSVRVARHLGGLSSRIIRFTEYPLQDKIFETKSPPRFSMTQDCIQLLSLNEEPVGGYDETRWIQSFYRRDVLVESDTANHFCKRNAWRPVSPDIVRK